jgi:ABC-2 type transport system permease protein
MNPFTPKVRVVIRREFMQRVKSKWFLFSTLGLPVLMVGLAFLAAFLAIRGAEDTGSNKAVGIADPSGLVADLLVEELLADSLLSVRAERFEGFSETGARERFAESSFDYLLLLPDGLVETLDGVPASPAVKEREGDEPEATLLARASVPRATVSTIRGGLQRALLRARLRALGVENVDAGNVFRRTAIDVINVTEAGEARSQELYQSISFGIAFSFYMILIIYGQMIIRSILEEKQSDIVEVMMSSLRPGELMLGKIVGVGAVGLVQMGIWAAIVAGAVVAGSTAGAFDRPADAGINMLALSIPWGTITLVLLFLVLGYLLFAGLFAATGATISNEQDATQAALPVTMLIILPFIAIQGVIQNPDAGWAVVISIIPFFSPIVMTSRLFITVVPLWQWTLSVVLLAAFVLGAAWVAGRIYRVGILMKGQRPNVPEVIRWVRHG